MAEHRRLGLPRRPAREEQDRGVLGVAFGTLVPGRTVGRQELVPGQKGQAGDAPTETGRHRRLHHRQPGRGALENGPQLGVGQAVVHRDIGDGGPGGAEQADGHRLGVDVHGHQPLGARFRQVARHRVGPLGELLVGEITPDAGGDRHPVPERVDGDFEERAQMHGRARSVRAVSRTTGAAWPP